MNKGYKPGDIRRVECQVEILPVRKADLCIDHSKIRELRDFRTTFQYEKLVECSWHRIFQFWEQDPVPTDAVALPGFDPDGQPTTVHYMWVQYEAEFGSWEEPLEAF